MKTHSRMFWVIIFPVSVQTIEAGYKFTIYVVPDKTNL